jgi:hypothetical protein
LPKTCKKIKQFNLVWQLARASIVNLVNPIQKPWFCLTIFQKLPRKNLFMGCSLNFFSHFGEILHQKNLNVGLAKNIAKPNTY